MNFINPGREKELISSNVHLFKVGGVVTTRLTDLHHWTKVVSPTSVEAESVQYYGTLPGQTALELATITLNKLTFSTIFSREKSDL